MVHCVSIVNITKSIVLGEHWSTYTTVTLHWKDEGYAYKPATDIDQCSPKTILSIMFTTETQCIVVLDAEWVECDTYMSLQNINS